MTTVHIATLLYQSSNISGSVAFSFPATSSTPRTFGRIGTSTLKVTNSQDTDAAFSAFADALEEDELFADENEEESVPTWQESLEAFLDPMTPAAKKQVLLSDLVSANEDIRKDVQSAVRERKLDRILTPTGKKLQDGTRAVARQITSDILPSIAASANGRERETSSLRTPPIPRPEELPTLVPKIGSAIFDAMSAQARKQVEQLQQDLQDPVTRIPERISKQTAELKQEARNVFLETPEGLKEPKYTVISKGDGYEIREYEAYDAASTTMSSNIEEPYKLNDLTGSGSAFNALASYLFGANEEERAMEMTTPVVTTSSGEMRFYLYRPDDSEDQEFPAPRPSEKDDVINTEKGAVKIINVPATRLAVSRFTGFVTDGEVARQKDALLGRLENDGVEIDVPHGSVVPHVVLQYNPPYTIPIVRRNELAIPVRRNTEVDMVTSKKEWGVEEEEAETVVEEEDIDDGLAPSDVE